jgi:sialidase-1
MDCDLHPPGLTRRQFLAASALSAAAFVSRAEASLVAPGLETADLFTAGTGGYTHYRIPGIVVTARGSLLVYCEGRHDARGDWGDIDVLMRRSTDGGRTWSPQRVLVDVQEKIVNPASEAQNIAGSGTAANNPVAIVDHETGAVHFLYCAEYARCFYMRSEDDGRTFSTPVDITAVLEGYRAEYPWAVIATGPGHGIQLRNGRLLVPLWMSTGEGGHAHRPSAVATLYSDDHGTTWRRGEIVAAHGVLYPAEAGGRTSVTTLVNPSETVAVELSDGRVMLNIRSESPESRRAVTVSPDGGSGWSAPAFDPELYEPVCMGSIAKLSAAGPDRGRIVFANPDSRHIPKKYGSTSGPRENLTLRLSNDDGHSWPARRVLDPGISGYSDLAVGPDDTLYCFYERGRVENEGAFTTAHLTLARFEAAWLTDSSSGTGQPR